MECPRRPRELLGSSYLISETATYFIKRKRTLEGVFPTKKFRRNQNHTNSITAHVQ